MQREGCVLTAYPDVLGILTIGTGHTGMMSPPPVISGMTITQEQADAFLQGDLESVETAINEHIVKPMTQNQFDAMASLAFNIGVNGFIGSTVARDFNLGLTGDAANAFLLWDRPAVLLARRQSEKEQFLTPDDEQIKIA